MTTQKELNSNYFLAEQSTHSIQYTAIKKGNRQQMDSAQVKTSYPKAGNIAAK